MLSPLRFGKHVRDVVYPEGTRFHPATYQSSGVVARFVTNSKNLAFSYAVSTLSASQSFDVWADNVFYATQGCAPTEGRVEVKLPEGEKTVTIYFPHHEDGKIFDVALDDGASFAAAPARKYKALFIGDSITHGSTAAHASMTYAHQLSRALDIEVVNQGIGGEGFNPNAVDNELNFTPDLVSVSYGTNNWSHDTSYEEMETGANAHLQALRAKYPTTPMAVILPIWRADGHMTKPTGTIEEVREILCTVAARFDAHVVDGLTLVPHVTEVFADKRLHPDEFGFQFYAENLVPHLKKILEE
jgi:lysophospholipase L1-like esterase